jgi:hypothetical protein
MARPIRNVLTKVTELFFKMYLLPEFSRFNNDSLFKLTGQNVSRPLSRVFGKILEFGFRIIKNSILH